jgi:hypothetical protein
VLDPQEVYGSDFPGETFRVLKEKEIKQYGEFRARRLVLEKWDEMSSTDAVRSGHMRCSAPVSGWRARPVALHQDE